MFHNQKCVEVINCSLDSFITHGLKTHLELGNTLKTAGDPHFPFLQKVHTFYRKYTLHKPPAENTETLNVSLVGA